ncbi:Hpt domain-containing protein [Desulfonatronospira sp.]|uniref:Hpt domain-containing protein n=1 Tax=Desulfonatronospira sp. TaxID=1962951 RepID=UPI0025BE8942|nr:Hpt domain-containing protein [Desulfonatronospira sp.]
MDKSQIYLENLDRIFSGDKALILKACQSFIKHSKTYMEIIHEAHKHKNGPEMQRIAHSFKASFVMFGDEDAQKAANDLEQIGIADQWDNCDTKIRNFDDHLQCTIHYVQNILNSSFTNA